MEAIFLGGSRRIARLNDNIRSKLDDFIELRLWIFVGDANGADRAMQQHFADRGYQRVTVYAVARSLRNNVGDWKVCLIEPPKGARGFELYSAKDKQMARDASYGLMLWDGKSRGTLENVKNLLVQGKPVAVHLGPTRRFVSLGSVEELCKLGLPLEVRSHPQADLLFSGSPRTSKEVTADDRWEPSLSKRPSPRQK